MPRAARTGQAPAGPTTMHVCAYTCVHGHIHAYRHVCVPVSVYAHVCVFSSLQRLLDLGSRSPGPDSARVRQRRAAAKSPGSCLPFSTSPVSTTAHHTQDRRFLLHVSGSVTGDKGAQLCDDCPVKIGAHRHPEAVPAPPSARRSGESLPLPHASRLPPQSRREMEPRGPEPGSKAALTQRAVFLSN